MIASNIGIVFLCARVLLNCRIDTRDGLRISILIRKSHRIKNINCFACIM